MPQLYIFLKTIFLKENIVLVVSLNLFRCNSELIKVVKFEICLCIVETLLNRIQLQDAFLMDVNL